MGTVKEFPNIAGGPDNIADSLERLPVLYLSLVFVAVEHHNHYIQINRAKLK